MIYAIGSEPHSLFPGRELGSNEASNWLSLITQQFLQKIPEKRRIMQIAEKGLAMCILMW